MKVGEMRWLLHMHTNWSKFEYDPSFRNHCTDPSLNMSMIRGTGVVCSLLLHLRHRKQNFLTEGQTSLPVLGIRSLRASPTKPLFLTPYFSHMRTSHSVSLSYFKMNSNKPLIFAPLLSTLIFYWYGPTTMSIVLNKHFLQWLYFVLNNIMQRLYF